MTADASRSCLGLETCVGSAIRQIVLARVLLTATAPPALPGSPMLGGSLAPPVAAIIGLVRSVCRHRHLPGDGPHEARQFAGDRGGTKILFEDGRATGLQFLNKGGVYRADREPKPGDQRDWATVERELEAVYARNEIILSGGAFNTPQ